MILLRSGRSAQSVGSILDIDTTFDLGSAHGRPRHERFAPWRPPIEVFEADGALVARAEIGGLSSGELHVIVVGDQLRIRGERIVSRPAGPRLYHESRIRYGPFEAVVQLPFPVDVDSASAEYIDGILSVRLPRLAATKVLTRDDTLAAPAHRGDQ